MAVLTLNIDDRNITDIQYQQALKIVKRYTEAQKKVIRKQKLIEAKAKAVNDYQLNAIKVIEPIIISEATKEIEKKVAKVRTIKLIHKPEVKPIETNFFIEEKVKKPTKPRVAKDNGLKKTIFHKDLGSKKTIKANVQAPELDGNGNVMYFNLDAMFSAQFVNLLNDYFKEFKGYELNVFRTARSNFRDINIFKFNRITKFKSYHVLTLVKFLNDNNISCTHTVDRYNKLVAKEIN